MNKETFVLNGNELIISREDIVEAFNKTKMHKLEDKPGRDPYWKIEINNERKPVKDVLVNINKLPANFSLNDFTSQDARRIFEKLGFRIVNERQGGVDMETEKIDKTLEGGALESEKLCRDEFNHLRSEGRIEFITFHPSYSYEEFIEGITVETKGENIACENPQYKLKPGIFKNMCKKALAAAIDVSPEDSNRLSWGEIFEMYQKKDNIDFSKAPKYVLIIDEINRGDIAKIFGELITLIEADKRLRQSSELIVRLPASGDSFGVPPNLYIIGTMNTADRSIALLDVALRRRFGFIEMNPDFTILMKEHIERNKIALEGNQVYDLLVKSSEAIQRINKRLCADKTIGRDRQIGHSFLFKVFTIEDLLLVWKHEIFPLLEEYCYSDYKKINYLLFNKDGDTEWISELEGIKEIQDISKMVQTIV